MSTMAAMMTKLGTSPVNADTAAAKSRIKTNGLLNRSIRALTRPFGLADSIWFGPTALRMAAASGALRPAPVECRNCRRSESGRTAKSSVPGAACCAASFVERALAGCRAAALGVTESGWFMFPPVAQVGVARSLLPPVAAELQQGGDSPKRGCRGPSGGPAVPITSVDEIAELFDLACRRVQLPGLGKARILHIPKRAP